jgi:methyltransferase (TIGR00027 family)
MEAGKPSRTAFGAAAHRAAHQLLEKGDIFSDPLAVRILGEGAETAIRRASVGRSKRPLRLFIAIRARFTEDAWAAAQGRGTDQVVILGAGLDTFAYRNRTTGAALRIFEVDHPATQAWKRRRLAKVGIAVPAALRFVPVDFEHESLDHALRGAGFDPARPAFVSWLGVVPYLSEGSIFATLRSLASFPGGVEVVFDYANPGSATGLARRVARIGEPIRSYFDPARLHAELAKLGYRDVEDLGSAEMRHRYFPDTRPPSTEHGAHLLRAATTCRSRGGGE